MKNEYGLDTDYFRRVIERELRDISRKTPAEFARVCMRMAVTASQETLAEGEFVRQFAEALGADPERLKDDLQVGSLLRKGHLDMPYGWDVRIDVNRAGSGVLVIDPDECEVSYSLDRACLSDAIGDAFAGIADGTAMQAYAESNSSATLSVVVDALRRLIEADGDAGLVMLHEFADFEAFKGWWETLEHYEQEDGDVHPENGDEILLKLAFNQLRAELPMPEVPSLQSPSF